MPIYQVNELVRELCSLGYKCRAGDLYADIGHAQRPYFERWLSNRDGFVSFEAGNIDYVGFEDVVRMGPFFNVYFLIENSFIVDEDENAHILLDASPYYKLYNGTIKNFNWSGGILADILRTDNFLYEKVSADLMQEEVKKLSVRATNYACLIETRTWDTTGLASIFPIIDRIGFQVRELLKQVHLGENIQV